MICVLPLTHFFSLSPSLSFFLLLLFLFVTSFSFLSVYQTISIVYIVTAVVGVETWYKPLIWNILYRDLFIVMILGERVMLTCVSHHRDS